MDVIATIIVTAFINILITGIVSNVMFYRYQKRIENSFAESLIEHKTKFERHHIKEVEALECLYQKIIVISKKYEEMVHKCTDFYENNLEFVKSMDLSYMGLELKDMELLKSQSNEFVTYFDNNRLFLRTSSVRSVRTIHQRVDTLIQLVPYYLDKLFIFDETSPEFIFRINESVEKYDLGKNKIREHWDLLSLFSNLVEDMNKQTETLELLYKSIAETE